jgi:cytochrome c553
MKNVKYPLIVLGLAALMGAGLVQAAQTHALPPSWPYGQPPLPPGVVPPQAPAPRTPAVRDPNAPRNPNAPPPQMRHADGSPLEFTQQQISDSYGPADWFPGDHPPMPERVAHGKPGVARACGLCHLPNGRGRPENAPVQGLPYDYIVQQLHDFQQGVRHSAEPRKANTLEMENIAKTLSEDEVKELATYFSSMKWTKYIRVVETDMVPGMRIAGEIYYPVDGAPKEPIGTRIIEMPENPAQTQVRNPRSGYVAYVPVGSIARGKTLATTGGGGKTTPCSVCHGPDLKGLGPIPNLAGRSPSYLVRQIYDMKLGTRHGSMAALMVPVVANLTDADIVDLIAYVSSLEP